MKTNIDWIEDFELENGKYECVCVICHEHFLGHKRRMVCKICARDEALSEIEELRARCLALEADNVKLRNLIQKDFDYHYGEGQPSPNEYNELKDALATTPSDSLFAEVVELVGELSVHHDSECDWQYGNDCNCWGASVEKRKKALLEKMGVKL